MGLLNTLLSGSTPTDGVTAPAVPVEAPPADDTPPVDPHAGFVVERVYEAPPLVAEAPVATTAPAEAPAAETPVAGTPADPEAPEVEATPEARIAELEATLNKQQAFFAYAAENPQAAAEMLLKQAGVEAPPPAAPAAQPRDAIAAAYATLQKPLPAVPQPPEESADYDPEGWKQYHTQLAAFQQAAAEQQQAHNTLRLAEHQQQEHDQQLRTEYQGMITRVVQDTGWAPEMAERYIGELSQPERRAHYQQQLYRLFEAGQQVAPTPPAAPPTQPRDESGKFAPKGVEQARRLHQERQPAPQSAAAVTGESATTDDRYRGFVLEPVYN